MYNPKNIGITQPAKLLLLAAIAAWCFAGLQCKQKESNVVNTKQQRPDYVVVNNQKYPVETILNMTTDDLKAFVRAVIAEEIPANYKVPDYIANGTNIDTMYQIFWKRYPQFAGLHADALLTEVSMNPDIYIALVTENKTLRKKAELIDSIEFAKQKQYLQKQKQNQ